MGVTDLELCIASKILLRVLLLARVIQEVSVHTEEYDVTLVGKERECWSRALSLVCEVALRVHLIEVSH
jgi:hypothetical protein